MEAPLWRITWRLSGICTCYPTHFKSVAYEEEDSLGPEGFHGSKSSRKIKMTACINSPPSLPPPRLTTPSYLHLPPPSRLPPVPSLLLTSAAPPSPHPSSQQCPLVSGEMQ
ncbi:hypothetical protein E2C01_034373 [Portunus trituberculatus]|uniref:Uncharacterized protein n=1 Tax=Portunus trituberculatus TaxID=210409 RepID=A0A5B7F8C8_PORTR|nr:hypothetical protein [Portunus trituberculatus]